MTFEQFFEYYFLSKLLISAGGFVLVLALIFGLVVLGALGKSGKWFMDRVTGMDKYKKEDED